MPSARRCQLLVAFGCIALLGASPALILAQPLLPPDRNPLSQILDESGLGEPIPIEKAIQFSVRGNELVVASGLKLQEGATQLRLRGLEGITRVISGQRPRGMMGLVPYFELTHTGPASDDGAGSAQTTIAAHGSSISISHKTRIGDVETTVTLSQDMLTRRGRPIDRGPDRVRMTARTTRTTNPAPRPAEDYRLAAPSFGELLRQCPGPTARYLGPLFREFGQDTAVFRIDSRIAWQLFPNAADADEATASKVLALIDRLDDDDFRERELATAGLEVIGGPALLVLGEVDRETLSPEQNTRVDSILARFHVLDDEEAVVLREDVEFLLRCFTYSDIQPVRLAAVRALTKRLGDDANADRTLDPRAKLPARIHAADMLRRRLPS